MPPAKKKKEIIPAIPQIGDEQRSIARESLRQTQLLEAALKKGDLAAVRSSLEAGALPEHAVFRDKKGRPTTSALAHSMNHEDASIAKLLIEFGAPLPLTAPGNVWHAALNKDRTELFPLLLSKVKPRSQEWEVALSRPLHTFRVLDELTPLDRIKNLGRLHKTGTPPLFLVVDPELLNYLLETGADPHQVPMPTPVDAVGEDSWHNRTVVNHLIRKSHEWSIRMVRLKETVADLVARLHEGGALVVEEDFWQACSSANRALLFFFIDQGFRMPLSEDEMDPDYNNHFRQLLAIDKEVAEDVLRYQISIDEASLLAQGTAQGSQSAISRRL